jgi:hypothetical protein
MAMPGRAQTTGVQHVAATRLPRRTSRHAILTLEQLVETLQDVLGPEDTMAVTVTCQVLSVGKATFLNTAVWRDITAFEE